MTTGHQRHGDFYNTATEDVINPIILKKTAEFSSEIKTYRNTNIGHTENMKLTICHFGRMLSIQKKEQQRLDLEGL